jgi:molybdopterin-containing oxidoreductase family membrane subunit
VADVLMFADTLRKVYGLEDFITMRHLDHMAKVMLAPGLIVAYGYFIETLMAWYSGNIFEQFMMVNRMFGPYAWVYNTVMFCNVLAPQALWSGQVRRSVPALFVVALIVNVGMWLERYMIIVVSLSRDFLPSAWGTYAGTRWDWATLVGSIGLFLTLMFLFVRFLPVISIY